MGFTYMSPERCKGQAYSYPSDVWSLGILLVESATGRYPYRERENGMHMELLAAILDQPAPGLPPDMSPQFHDFVKKCLRKNPRERSGVTDLMNHPWLKGSKKEDLVEWIAENDLCNEQDSTKKECRL